jgi:hypothetical protein
MEGALIVIKAWAMVAGMLWLHRRFFEQVARPDPEFEAWCESGPLIAALTGNAAELERVEAALRARLGKQQRLIATLGGWPWPNYELEVSVSRTPTALRLSIAKAELRRTHGTPAPGLVAVMRELLNAHPGAIDDLWLLPSLVYGKTGPDAAPGGWTVLAGDDPRPRVQARATAPHWLDEAAQPEETRDVSADQLEPKTSQFHEPVLKTL